MNVLYVWLHSQCSINNRSTILVAVLYPEPNILAKRIQICMHALQKKIGGCAICVDTAMKKK